MNKIHKEISLAIVAVLLLTVIIPITNASTKSSYEEPNPEPHPCMEVVKSIIVSGEKQKEVEVEVGSIVEFIVDVIYHDVDGEREPGSEDPNGYVLEKIKITDNLPDGLEYVDGSASEDPDEINDQTIYWDLTHIDGEELKLYDRNDENIFSLTYNVMVSEKDTFENIVEVNAIEHCYNESRYNTSSAIVKTKEGGEEEDDTPPEVEITRPKQNTLYIDDEEIKELLFFKTIISGPITVEVDATDEESDIEYVKFYLSGIKKGEDDEAPYELTIDEESNFTSLKTLKVVARDTSGNENTAEITFWKLSDSNLFLKLIKAGGVIAALLLVLSLIKNRQTDEPEDTEDKDDEEDPNKNVNKEPVAEIEGPYEGKVNQKITFDASGSYDSDDDQLEYQWHFGDGSNGKTGPKVTHTYTEEGEYTVELTVYDNKGGSSTDTILINIESDKEKAVILGEEIDLFWLIVSVLGVALLAALIVFYLRRELYE